jgi:enterobactin synthetase component D
MRLPEEDAMIDALARGVIPAEEQAYAANLTAVRRRTWVGGRVAMRHALARAGIDAPPVLVDARGAPTLPPDIAGSISHKESLAVALVQRGSARLGVDVERETTRAHDIASMVLTEEEAVELAALDARERERQVLLRFSIKEAIYKALDPFVRRYVGFKEVSVMPWPGGSAEVRVHLPASEGAFAIEAQWRRWERFVLTTARVERG